MSPRLLESEFAARSGNDLPQVSRKTAGQTLRHGARTRGGVEPFSPRRADPGTSCQRAGKIVALVLSKTCDRSFSGDHCAAAFDRVDRLTHRALSHQSRPPTIRGRCGSKPRTCFTFPISMAPRPPGNKITLAWSPDYSTKFRDCPLSRFRVVLLATTTSPRRRSRCGLKQVSIAVSVSPDGLRLASAGRDQKVTLWDTTPGRRAAGVTDAHRPHRRSFLGGFLFRWSVGCQRRRR